MERKKHDVLLISGAGDGGLLARLLEQHGVAVFRAESFEGVREKLNKTLFDVVVLHLDRTDALLDLPRLSELCPDTPVVVSGPDERMHQALLAGAAEYLSWPAPPAALKLALDSALARTQVAGAASPWAGLEALLGKSEQMLKVKNTLGQVAGSNTTVLVRGETGTGKELVARAVHAGSARSNGPFVKVHAAALPDALFESELFGYEKGAFTGAVTRKLGRVELAEGGTLFLDEIGELSQAMQVKLLRLIQDREYERLGGTRTLFADVRFVTATHRDIEHMVDTGAFRQDLFYRLNVVTVWVPPLRARREDIALIARHYLQKFCAANEKPGLILDAASLAWMRAQRWPGNVRQLVNFIERLVVLAQDNVITIDGVTRSLEEQKAFLTQAAQPPELASSELPTTTYVPRISSSAASSPQPPADDRVLYSSEVRPLREDVRRTEYHALLKALHSASGNRALAARMLGVSRRTLYTKLAEHGIT